MNKTDEAIHEAFRAIKEKDIKWNNFPNIGLCESYYMWYYAENRLYAILDCMTDGLYLVEARNPVEAFKHLMMRLQEAMHAGYTDPFNVMTAIRDRIKQLPPIQPEITHEQAVEYLQSTGWMREHDLQMMLDGVHRLTVQPEIVRCKDCKYWIPYDWMFSEVWQSRNIADYPEDEIGCVLCDMTTKADDFCSRAERREVTK